MDHLWLYSYRDAIGDVYQKLQKLKRNQQLLPESLVWRIFTQVTAGVH